MLNLRLPQYAQGWQSTGVAQEKYERVMANFGRNGKFDDLPTELLSGGGVAPPHPTVEWA